MDRIRIAFKVEGVLRNLTSLSANRMFKGLSYLALFIIFTEKA